MQSAKRKVNKKIKSSQTIKNDERLIFMVYVCEVCGWMYDEDAGCPEMDITPGTKFEDLPDDFECPLCHVGKEMFAPEK